MKKTIRGTRYDTETAREIASAQGGKPGTLEAWSACLYRTRGGRYFLAGKGGPMTRFGQAAGRNKWWPPHGTGCGDLIPMTEDEAQAWLRAYVPKAFRRLTGDKRV